MRLTVLLTTYNHERFVAQALDSVLMQRTSFEFDILVLDDCSTDRTRDVLRAYHERFPSKIDLRVAERNQCDNRAFMDAWSSTDARYVAVLDGDDFWTSSDKLQRQVDYLEEHPEASICFHNALVFRAKDGSSWLHTPLHQRRVSNARDLWTSNFIAGCSSVLRREVVPQLPQWFETCRWGDLPLYILLAEKGEIHYLNEVMGCYRLHDGGLWSSLTEPEKLAAFLDFCESVDPDLASRHREALVSAVNNSAERLRLERRRLLASARQEWRRLGGSDPAVVEGVRRAVASAVPPGASVAVATQGDASLLVLDRPAQHLVATGDWGSEEQLFAQGDQGQAEARWIQDGKAYEFRLYAGTERERLLAAVTVTGALGSMPGGPLAGLLQEELERSPRVSPVIMATPNPAQAQQWPAATTVAWHTAGAGSGQVYLSSVRGLDDYIPMSDLEAIAHVERLRTAGVAYLVLPATARWWLEELDGLRRHLEHEYELVADDPDTCAVYALHWAKVTASGPQAPTVSVVIPCFNHARFLRDAVESALRQTYDDIEIIVVDDGSTDETALVASTYRAVSYLWQENSGLAAARNAGLAASRGRFCVFLDSDDRLLPNAIETGLRELDQHPEAAFASGLCTLIGPDGCSLFTPDQFVVEAEHYAVLLQNNYIWNPGSVVYRRWVLDCLGGFDIRRDAAADYDLYLRITRLLPVRSHGNVVAEYRQHGTNMSHDSKLMSATIRDSLETHRDFVRTDSKLQAALEEGKRAAETFYGDDLLNDIRAHWARRMEIIEPFLATARQSEERQAVIDELRSLYRWMLEVYGLRRLLQQKTAGEIELRARNRKLEVSNEGARRLLGELRSRLERNSLEAEVDRQAFVDIQQAVRTHVTRLDVLQHDQARRCSTDVRAQLQSTRDDLDYQTMVAAVRSIVRRVLPIDATVVVISGGDDDLVDISPLFGWHFPRTEDGWHAGSHPADAHEALIELDVLRNLGAGFLLVPATERWWLSNYLGLEQGLEHRGRRLWDDESCVIFRLE